MKESFPVTYTWVRPSYSVTIYRIWI